MNKWKLVLFIFAVATRFHNLNIPDYVCWDETHFGKMANWYLSRTFFLDVHPPLAKLLIAGVGKIAGLDAREIFHRPGDHFNSTAYVWMRSGSAASGVASIMLAVSTLSSIDQSGIAATVCSVLMLFDCGFILLTKLILVDPYVIVLITAILNSTSGWLQSGDHWRLQLLSGLLMGAALSSKFTSVLTVGFVGLRVLERLLGQVSDATIRVEVVIKHFLSTFTLLGLIPILIYLLIFQIHFIILEHSGPFDYFFSSLLQSTLVGNPLHNITAPQYIFSGTVVSLRNCQSGSGYLHSHLYTYPKTISELQQVTGYTHADSNNLWLIEKFHNIPDNLSDSQRLSLGDGDLIQLRHLKTNGTLEVQSLSAPLSKRNYLVGVNNAGSDNNGTKWQLKAIRRSGPIRNLIDRFQLISVDPSCVLTVGNRQLPKWGSHQSEISCDRRRNRPADVSHWVAGAQEKLFPDQSDVKMSELGPSFLEKMTEVHSVMLQINSRFKAELGEESSAPLYWPLNLFGQTLMTKSDRIYMMGNPVIWWFIAPFLLLFPFIFITVLAVVKRQLVCGNKEASKALNLQLLKEAGWLWLGWAIHYAPFFLMSRILYFHHYYPAFIFSCLFSGTLVGWIILTFLPFKLRQPILTIFVLVISGSFCFFYPLAYGMKPGKNYNHLRWLQSWNF